MVEKGRSPGADMTLREQRIGGRRVFEGKLLTLEVDEVLVPTGTEAVREVIRHPGAAVMLPLLDDGRVLLVRQYRYAVDQVLLELPAGKLDAGEKAETCAARELAEETGYRPRELELLGRFVAAPGFSDEELHAYLATSLVPDEEAIPDADELIDIVAIGIDEVRQMIRSGGIADAKTLATWCLAEAGGFLPRP